MRNIENKKSIFFILILAVVLCVLLAVGIFKDNMMAKENAADYNKWYQAKKENSNETSQNSNKDDKKATETVTQDLVEKLHSKQNIRVLVLGDGLALSAGRTSSSGIWQEGFKSSIKSYYGSDVEMVSLAKNRSSAKDGLDTVVKNNIKGYDLVITCFGHNDNMNKSSIDEFETSYNTMIAKIKEVNNPVQIIAIVPNTLDKNNAYRDKILELSSNNGILIADMKQAFLDYGGSESSLLNENVPNDTGYQLYTKTLFDTLKSIEK